MNAGSNAPGIIIVGHGSSQEAAQLAFVEFVRRVASRLGTEHVLPAFCSSARPNIADQIAAFRAQGLRRIVLLPYFLYSGRHVTTDIPAVLDQCRQQYPELTLELLPSLENDPALEDMLVERLLPLVPPATALPADGAPVPTATRHSS
jgi:sirohydrochlorin cobaltochelatase